MIYGCPLLSRYCIGSFLSPPDSNFDFLCCFHRQGQRQVLFKWMLSPEEKSGKLLLETKPTQPLPPLTSGTFFFFFFLFISPAFRHLCFLPHSTAFFFFSFFPFFYIIIIIFTIFTVVGSYQGLISSAHQTTGCRVCVSLFFPSCATPATPYMRAARN
uniref:Uncharacterized protein n=1 Tax=Trypanosoma vivax (strain Y486) TaxID=1055687 RepID=G0U583_TRYVY|nr:hypothetical protein TVY486_1000850 [Trypanosoma vivax Y486]